MKTCKDCPHFNVCESFGVFMPKEIKSTFDQARLDLINSKWKNCKFKNDKSRIIELPCKVGDTVYRIIPKCHPEFGECPFDGGHGYSRCNGGYKKCNAYIEEETFDYFHIKCIGKNVFLTKKEAEAKLKELSEND